MTMTLPWRRITLHLSQIFLTLGLTFMVVTSTAGRAVCVGSLVAVDDTASGKVVGAQLDDNSILGQDADIVLTHLFPQLWPRTTWPFFSSTRNIALGRASITVPSISMTPSFFAISSVYPLHVSDRLRRMPLGATQS